MKLAYDRLAKEVLVRCLQPVSRELTPEREIATDPQRLDLWCVPDVARVHELAPLGLLLAIARAGPCAFEFFHAAPSTQEVIRSLRKGLALRSSATFPAQSDEPWLWIIAGGRPSQAIESFELEREPGWPAGVYGATPGVRLRLVVASELPRTPDTLVLRALGAGKTLRDAQLELRELGLDHPISRIIVPIMLKLRFEHRSRAGHPVDPRDQEFQMETQDIYEAWHQKVLAEGEARGRAEGEARGRAEGEALGEVRALLRVIEARGLQATPAQIQRIRECRDLATLEAWLARAVTAASCDEVLA